MATSHQHPATKSQIQRDRKGDNHKQWCTLGYCKSAGTLISGDYTQIHHRICVQQMKDADISAKVKDTGQMEFIVECLKLTDWDINQDHNTVGLPRKRAFADPAAPTAPGPAGFGVWPCHQVEHNLYNAQLQTDLNRNVWQQVLENREMCTECNKECNIKAASVVTQLKGESKRLLTFLTERGHGTNCGMATPQPTGWAWPNRHSIQKDWYKPFSMSPTTIAVRLPPPNPTSLTDSGLRSYCNNVMFDFI